MYPLSDSRNYAALMCLFTGLFLFRVAAQFFLLFGDIPGLPSFQHWHSGVMPYWLLLTCQIMILAAMAHLAIKFIKGTMTPNRRLGKALWLIASIYFGVVLTRITLGLTIFSEKSWFTHFIPAFFHLLLASFLLVVAAFNRQTHLHELVAINRHLLRWSPWLAYPLVLLLGLFSHYVMAFRWHLHLALSTYLPIVLAGLSVLALEYLMPHDKKWHPEKRNVVTDALYMAIVQVILPKLTVPLLILLIVIPLQSLTLTDSILWPQQAPIWLQLILMILLADFLRYWIHRFAHRNPTLWRLHAVHHSADKLYWLNVGRFHPLEKVLQMLFDTVPFLALQVDQQVIALYFVFYSINGFFQHANIKLKFGWLNFLISSAQLHRWHHSKIVSESNTNYGNNLILWDLLFGTYFLPKNRQIRNVGLDEPDYPEAFIPQLRAPFRFFADKPDKK